MLSSKVNKYEDRLHSFLFNIVLHPFAFSCAIVLHEINSVKDQLVTEQAWPTLLTVEAFTVAIFALSLLFLRKLQQAGLVTTVILMLSFSYLGLDFFSKSLYPQAPAWVSLALTALLLLASARGILKSTWRFGKLTAQTNYHRLNFIFNVLTIFLLLCNGLPLLVFNIQEDQKDKHWISYFHQQVKAPDLKSSPERKPDVYYIILDAMAHSQTLSEFGAYDNSQFIDYLKRKGFYLPSRAASNYDRTHLSVTSSLNMQYVNAIAETYGPSHPDILYERAMASNVACSLFKKLGYKVVWLADISCPLADHNYLDEAGSVFFTAFLKLTPAWGIEQYFPFLRDNFAKNRLAINSHLTEIEKLPGPKFVFIHSNISHPPAIFRADGSLNPLNPQLLNDSMQDFSAYVEQVKFAEKETMKWIDSILDRPGPKPIIILQADHGPYREMPDRGAYFNEVMRILNAYYFPDLKKNSLYSTVTPVNSFRILLNDYFGAKLPILPDKCYCSPIRSFPYQWQEVQDKLKFGQESSGQAVKAP